MSNVMQIEFDEIVISGDLPVWNAREISKMVGPDVKVTLSEYLPVNHMSLIFKRRFVATIDITDHDDD